MDAPAGPGLLERAHHRVNLDDPQQRAYVYEQVLREDGDDDVRRFIDIDELVSLWPRLYLPPWVRDAWASWLRERRGIDLAC